MHRAAQQTASQQWEWTENEEGNSISFESRSSAAHKRELFLAFLPVAAGVKCHLYRLL
jgi:hypothetical protein